MFAYAVKTNHSYSLSYRLAVIRHAIQLRAFAPATILHLLRLYFHFQRYFNRQRCRNFRGIWLIFHNLIRMTGRNVPVRIASGVVQVHVSPAIQPVVAVAAHKRHSHAPEIPYYILSTVIFFVCCTFLRGRNPPFPLCCLRSVRHFARKTGRNAPARMASGAAQAHVSPAIQPVAAAAAHTRHSHNSRIY